MQAFLQQVAESLIAKHGSDLQIYTIVFNNKRPAGYLQKYLADSLEKPFWSPKFYTVQEFFATATTLKVADFYTQFFALYDSWQELFPSAENDKYQSVGKFQNLAKIILSDFAQIDADMVNAEKLFSELEDIAVINQQFDFLTDEQKEFLAGFWQSYNDGRYKKQQEAFIEMWRRMPLLYNRYHQLLNDQGFISMPKLYRSIANDTNNDFTEKYIGQKLIFIGFNALSKAEAKAFKRWQDEGKAIFYFDTDRYYLEDETQEAGLFLRRNLNQIGLLNQLQNDAAYIKTKKRAVTVYKTQGQVAQAKIINQLVSDEERANSLKENSATTAIVLADESLLLPLLQTIPAPKNPKQPEINVTMGLSLSQSSLFGLIDLWATVQKQLLQPKKTINFQTAQAFLSHPLIGVAETKRFEIQNKLIAEQLAEIPGERLAQQTGIIGKFFKSAPQNQLVSHLTDILTVLLQQSYHEKTLKNFDANLFVKAIQELNRLDDTIAVYIEKYHSKVDANFILGLIQQAMADLTVTLQGDALHGIQIMGLLETRNLNFDRVIVLGLNEGMVPKASTAPSFIPDSLRRAYGLPIIENQDAISAYMFYRLLQRAENINLVYNSLTDESNSGELSRFVKQLEYESGFSFLYKELLLSVKTETKREEIIVKNERIQQELNKFLTGKRKLSATALTTYISNPIDFFYKYIACIEEPKEVEETVEAYKLGLVLHYVMEYFYAELLAESVEITEECINAKRKDIPDLILEGFADTLYIPKDKWNETKAQRRAEVLKIKANLRLNGMQKVVAAIVKEYVDIILNHDAAHAPFTIVSLEQDGDVFFEFDAGRKVKLKGVIDRVDLKDGVYRIVDYKTGSDVVKFSTIADCFNSDETKINKALVQTLFYTYVYEQLSGNKAVEPHLYVVRIMNSKEGVIFYGDEGLLTGEFLALQKVEFLTKLKEKLTELFDVNIPFRASQAPDNYSYSIYKTLFGG